VQARYKSLNYNYSNQQKQNPVARAKLGKRNICHKFLMVLAQEMTEQVDLRKLNPNKSLDKTLTTLELLLCSLSKHLNLKIK